MEKRASPRRQINTSIVCNHFNSLDFRVPLEGEMKNCCSHGFHAELNQEIKAGTILVVRATGISWKYSIDEGFWSQALAEVKWSKRKSVGGDVLYATGLKYLIAY